MPLPLSPHAFLTRHAPSLSFYQIVSTFISSLDVPWPRTFTSIMARVNVVNINFVELPRTACLHPNTPFYEQFMGYTLGTTGGLALIGLIWAAGSRLLVRLSLRHALPDDKANRLRRFQTVCLSRALLLLYLVYPGVSGVVIAVFNCHTLASGRAYLVADHRVQCWTTEHWRYVGAGIFWLFAIPLGIPVAFLGLLYYFRVPQMAKIKVANAWLREAVMHTWRLGVPQPPVDVETLGFHDVSDAHLEMLVAVLVLGDEEAMATGVASCSVVAGGAHAHAQYGCGLRRLRRCGKGAAGDVQHTSSVRLSARRQALQKTLLHWCRTAGVLSLPPLAWSEPDEEVSDDAHKHDKPASMVEARTLRRLFSSFSTARLADSSAESLAALEQRALRKVGFLFESYAIQCWYWEVIELGRKLILTSILALVAPGSATQITVGTLVAFAMLLLFQRLRPYASDDMNFVASIAQVNLFCFLFVGLLLKVRLNGDARDSRVFNAIVGILSVVPIALPVTVKAAVSFTGGDDGDVADAFDDAGGGLFGDE